MWSVVCERKPAIVGDCDREAAGEVPLRKLSLREKGEAAAGERDRGEVEVVSGGHIAKLSSEYRRCRVASAVDASYAAAVE